MIKTKSSIEIKRSVRDVFAYITQVESFPNWFGEIVQDSRLVTPGPVGKGTQFIQINQFLGRRFETRFTVSEYEPDKQFCVATNWGPLPFQGCFECEPTESGTIVTDRHQIGSGGFFDMVGSLLVDRLRRQADTNLANLKKILEANVEDRVETGL